MKMKLILDVDTGIDDALAITYALGNKDVELIGVTTSFGNVVLDDAANNSLCLLDLMGHPEIPVFKGALNALNASGAYHVSDKLHRIHGMNGIGNVRLETNRLAQEINASDFMIEAAHKYKDDLILVCLGPLTNLAIALKKDLDAFKHVKRIVIMGGAFGVCGNTTPYAECNIYNDVEAAKMVFDADIDLYMIGLDVTLKTLITGKDIQSWIDCETKRSKTLAAMTSYYYSNEFKEAGGALHDPLAVDAAIDPDIITNWFDTNCTVELCETSKGRIIGNKELLNKKVKQTHIALDVDSAKFISRFVKMVENMLK